MSALACLESGHCDPAVIREEIREGLELSEFEELRERLQVSSEALAEAAGINSRTLHRRKKEGRFTPEESDRLYRLMRLYQVSVDAFGSSEAARGWLTRPATVLGERTPLAYADTLVGYEELLDVLDGIKYGTFG
jgi:putative toxin-antitoxin system antitoxin component (TIGR02293 family)